jgi:hypothetical protein
MIVKKRQDASRKLSKSREEKTVSGRPGFETRDNK